MSKLALLLLVALNPVFGARILGAVFTPSYSHQLAFQPIWRELSKRGHQVTVLTTNPMNDPSLINLTEIDLGVSYEIMRKHNADSILSSNDQPVFKRISSYMAALHEVAEVQLAAPKVQELIHSNQEFDLLLVEVIYPVQMAFAWRFQVPFVGLVSLDAPTRIHAAIGNPIHPALYPDYGLPFIENLSFLERLGSSLFLWTMLAYGNWRLYPGEDVTVRRYFGEDAPPLREIERNMSFLFTNVNPALSPVRPLVPNSIQIGGGIHLDTPKPLPDDIRAFLDGAKDGFVYFSLGSNVKSASLSEDVKVEIVETFRRLSVRVLWKFEDDGLEGIPANVKMVKWVPQTGVLAHRNAKVFVTQCGLQSMEEAIFYRVPMVGLPFYGDQFHNAQILMTKGLGVKLYPSGLKREELARAIKEVLEKSEFRENVAELAELMNDEETTGLEKAVWWTEYAIRHKGAAHFRSPARDLPLYQYFMLDVLGFILLVGFLTIFFFVKSCKFALYFLCRRKTKVKTN